MYVDAAGWLMINHEDLLARLDDLACLGGIGVERLNAAANADHHLADQSGADLSCYPTPVADHVHSILAVVQPTRA